MRKALTRPSLLVSPGDDGNAEPAVPARYRNRRKGSFRRRSDERRAEPGHSRVSEQSGHGGEDVLGGGRSGGLRSGTVSRPEQRDGGAGTWPAATTAWTSSPPATK